MIEFILVACLSGTSDDCRTETRLLTDLTLIQCITSSQFLVADWANNHPGWQVQRHSCRVFNPASAEL